jgi:hypothetical protein
MGETWDQLRAYYDVEMATIGLRTGVFPRWFALLGLLLGAVLLVAVSFADWFILVLPGWVAVVSGFILRRERARGRMVAAGRQRSGG